MEKKYYVYIWFNVDTFEVFYVGMGTGKRRFKVKYRNHLFNTYYELNKCEVRLYESYLTEDEARTLEKDLIAIYKPCCNLTKGGERTNGLKISKALKGRTFSDEHKRNLSIATKESWKQSYKDINKKEVYVLDENKQLIKKFKGKYKVGEWLYNEHRIGIHARSAQRKIDKYFKSGELFNNQFYFVENIDKKTL